MAQKRKNLAKIAKKGADKTPSESTERTVDIEAKERVNRLVDEVDADAPENDLLELDDNNSTPTNEDLNNIEWLQDEIKKLSEQNEILTKEAADAKEGYKKIYAQYESLRLGKPVSDENSPLVPESQLKNNVTELFMDVQNNFQGRNPERKPYKYVIPVPFMMKMIKKFPFLSEYRRF